VPQRRANWCAAKGGQVLPHFKHIVSVVLMLLCLIATVFQFLCGWLVGWLVGLLAGYLVGWLAIHNKGCQLGCEFQFLAPISGTPIGSGIPIPFQILDILVRFFFLNPAADSHPIRITI
jgi:hypothetical protein